VERLMRKLSLHRARRGKRVRTTKADADSAQGPGVLDDNFRSSISPPAIVVSNQPLQALDDA
jgi:hypothetical protein